MKEEINTMPKTSLYNMEGAAIGEVELSEELFAAPINTAAMHLVVRSILANQRQGTQSAAAASRSTARRAPAMHVTMATALRSSVTAASSLRPSPATMSSTCPRRSAAWPSRAP